MLVGGAAVAALLLPFAIGASLTPAAEETGATEVTRFADPDIVESSGLAVVDGLLVTVNDSGDAGRVFTVDPASGETVGVTSWSPDPTDVEAVAPAYERGAPTGEVWVGDIGDNLAARDSVTLLRVPVGRGDQEVQPARYRMVFEDGARDAESLLVHPQTGQILVVSKGVLGGAFYLAPEELSRTAPNVLRQAGPAVGIATDAAFFPDGRHLVVRTYGAAVVYSYPDLVEVGSFDLPQQQQGEAVAVDAAGDATSLLISSEGADQPVLDVPLPDDLVAQTAPVTTTPSDGAGDAPLVDDPAVGDGTDADPTIDGTVPWWPLVAVGVVGLVIFGALGAALVRGRRRRPPG
ncbi:hypothetical protein [Nocardioides alkalitolerans]|uniref:hypothetical protein n=1 Tax=Nocardioides alkalitolerans TaxID=281714 RepID=UPI000421E20B|nr:hypothetical protein [Nocardioides alkalitolerans]